MRLHGEPGVGLSPIVMRKPSPSMLRWSQKRPNEESSLMKMSPLFCVSRGHARSSKEVVLPLVAKIVSEET